MCTVPRARPCGPAAEHVLSPQPLPNSSSPLLPEPLAPNLDHRGEALGQISPQQRILRGSHQQLRAKPLSNGPYSPKVFRNLQSGSRKSGAHWPFLVPLPPSIQSSPHLSLLEGHQPGPPLNQPAVPPATTQHGPIPPETQGENRTFVSMGLGHNPVGLCWQSPRWVRLLGCREVGNRGSLVCYNKVITATI